MRDVVAYIRHAYGWVFNVFSLMDLIENSAYEIYLYPSEQCRIFYGPYPWLEDQE